MTAPYPFDQDADRDWDHGPRVCPDPHRLVDRYGAGSRAGTAADIVFVGVFIAVPVFLAFLRVGLWIGRAVWG